MQSGKYRNDNDRSQAAERYSDHDRDSEVYTDREETYRDGSLKNECWNTGRKHEEDPDD